MPIKVKTLIYDNLPIVTLYFKDQLNKIDLEQEIILSHSINNCIDLLNKNKIDYLIFYLGDDNENLKHLQFIRTFNPNLIILVTSVDNTFDILKRCLLKKVNAFLSKFADEEEITIALKSFLIKKQYLSQSNKNLLLNG